MYSNLQAGHAIAALNKICPLNLSFKCFLPTYQLSKYTQIRHYAARKGTREKARKKKVKVEVKKVEFVPHSKRSKKVEIIIPRRIGELRSQREPIDNVYMMLYYKQKTFELSEAVRCLRENNHPTVFNAVSSPVFANIELDMSLEKKNRYMDDFSKMIGLPYPFETNEDRSILVLCKNSDLQKEAIDSGAVLAGGVELINNIQNGQVSIHDFQYVIAHPEILPELSTLRGLMKRKFPSAKNETLGTDIKGIVETFHKGILCSVKKNEHKKDIGYLETVVGTLNMDVSELDDNLKKIISEINAMRPRKAHRFITHCQIYSPPAKERLSVKYEAPVDIENVGKESKEDKDSDIVDREDARAAAEA